MGEATPAMLGRYEILGRLGTGGMATVYLARNAGEHGFQRLCAVKVLHPHLAEDPGFMQMLLDEAQIAARLHHPNVVPIIDLGTHDGILYVAMEYVEGCSLSALLRKRPDERPANLLVAIVLDMLAGLDAAHSLVDEDGSPMQLVHRDVSPQNVLIGVDGTARITDFGIARASSRVTSTRPGQLKGKIAYMAPEQVRSGEIDRRCDVFAAGALLWSLLTGRKLFVGDNDAATMNNILHLEVPPPSTIGLRPSSAFDAVCLRALQRDRDERFATAQEMEDALRVAALSAGLLAQRRDVGEWIVRSFRDELAERRRSIRELAAGRAERASTVMRTAELPSFTPSSSLPDTRPGIDAIARARTAADDAPVITVTRHRRTPAAWWALPGVAAIAVASWLMLRPSHADAPVRAADPITAPAPAALREPPPVPVPVPVPVPAPAPAPAPVPVPAPAPAPVPAAAPSPVAATPPRAAPPRAALRRAQPPAHKPPPPPPPAPPATKPAAPTPSPPSRWDSDSPLPPP